MEAALVVCGYLGGAEPETGEYWTGGLLVAGRTGLQPGFTAPIDTSLL